MKAIILALVALIAIGGTGAVYAEKATQQYFFPNAQQLPHGEFNWSACQDDRCFVYIPKLGPSFGIDNSNRVMDIFLPDGTCNLGGIIQSNGQCSFPSIILTSSDFVRLQNDPAFMAVLNISDTTTSNNADFCPLANIIWNGQTASYQQKLLVPTNLYNLVVPVDCQSSPPPVVVPEFGPIAALILVIALVSTIAISNKLTGLTFQH